MLSFFMVNKSSVCFGKEYFCCLLDSLNLYTYIPISRFVHISFMIDIYFSSEDRQESNYVNP